ncbi:hypothetical protein [Streptomyces capoamus]|uniref:hypothetical protein n=1 Tax=Streptomyces capoamus TaxID=68183 RepID=UPI0033955103
MGWSPGKWEIFKLVGGFIGGVVALSGLILSIQANSKADEASQHAANLAGPQKISWYVFRKGPKEPRELRVENHGLFAVYKALLNGPPGTSFYRVGVLPACTRVAFIIGDKDPDVLNPHRVGSYRLKFYAEGGDWEAVLQKRIGSTFTKEDERRLSGEQDTSDTRNIDVHYSDVTGCG